MEWKVNCSLAGNHRAVLYVSAVGVADAAKTVRGIYGNALKKITKIKQERKSKP